MSETNECLNDSIYNNLFGKWNDKHGMLTYFSYCLKLLEVNGNNNIFNTCEKLLRNVEEMKYDGYNESYLFARCKLLNYWLQDSVYDTLGSGDATDYKKIIENMHDVWNHYNKYFKTGANICKPESVIISFHDIANGRNIHECCLNHYTNKIKNARDDCISYYGNIKSKWPQYGISESLFSEEDKGKCRMYYDKCRTYNPKLDFLNVHCLKGVIKDKNSSNTNSQSNTQYTDVHPSEVPGEMQVEGEMYGDATSTTTSHRIRPIGMSLGLSFLGMILLSTVLYKFTPLKFALNKFINNYKNSRHNVDDETFREFLEHTYDSGNNNMKKEQNYIAYHSI
ncbi:variable surface protein [Plasmodium gonderi]|uniref:Variable surface protein n=1 Tax=Plasmodium gonderi TaxID=77519 RepID=A0A1Y1JTC1_PLAGO|nr:variable surface protein [Plasmodium gonderi]GAW84022.1 variable surface protein [Plasmodium gonderi]